ncbi:phosphoenolpyruvate--protein phosphotransferase [Kiloniella laminariae]|uniref:phosphoenolpyruvate--protein phosphotransferase n=1 Tax=Kiloniella laminariae TaxID=454162 RepID=A0ABT4LM65_9PROT|nr:phosphoenolpyruvate--protein phosphotransferase [Kiloniella laminariae]MCZ4282156.1 phosphoenolpyruvate--protein phosphotransferase [Kiloniella laminariae]
MSGKDVKTSAWSGSRRLLKLLRDQMKGKSTDQDRLRQTVELIARDMDAEVCSIYVMRPGDFLELAATEGLKPEAVYKTRLHKGEGIVGQVAALALPMAVSDAPRHPNFAYRPETGEEPYQSMLGVPILRSGRVLGVIAVQNVTHRHYHEEEVEALETIAMVLAELISGGALTVSAIETQGSLEEREKPDRLKGLCLNEGLGIGQAVFHNRGIVISRIIADDPEDEVRRLEVTVAEMRSSIDEMLTRTEIAALGEQREVLETYRMFAEDRGWVGKITEAIRVGGMTAEAAVQKIQNETRSRMGKISDPYLRERLADLDDLANRLLHHLLGLGDEKPELPDEFILLARTLGPAELLDYDWDRLKGVILEEGSPTAHVALVAQALELPILGRCRDVLSRIREGDTLVLDATNDQVFVRPKEDVLKTLRLNVKDKKVRWEEITAARDVASVSLDGHRISLNVNVGLLIDLPHMHAAGADGVGLYRTEVPFMVRQSFPGVADQADLYRKVIDRSEGKPVVFRTLDVGGDKVLPYWSTVAEENPAMGWRAIRIGLDRPALLRQQLRALIRACEGRDLNVMFPMIAETAEFLAAKALLDRELERETSIGGILPKKIRVGAMLEVPALVWQLPSLCREVDFLSVGSNDLLQFVFATDRGNTRLARRYDALNPGVLKLLRTIADSTAAAGVDLSLCGDMAAQPLEAMALIGCGFRSLSMPALQVSAVKKMVCSLDVAQVTDFMSGLLDEADHSLREKLEEYAKKSGVVI